MKIKSALIVVSFFLIYGSACVNNNSSNYSGKEDSVKIINLLANAENYIKDGSKDCSKEIANALTMAEAANSSYLKALCYCMFASAERKYRSPLLLEYDAAALKNARKSKNDSLLLHCLFTSCHDWCATNKMDSTEKFADEFKLLSKKTLNKVLQMRTGYEWGYYLFKKNEYDAARESYLQALAIANALHDEHWMALIKRTIYQCEALSFYPGKQSSYIFDAYSYFKQKDDAETASCLSVTGKAYFLNGNIEKALEYYEAAADLYNKTKYSIEEAEANIAIAETWLSKKEITKGIAATVKADSLFKSFSYIPGKIYSLIMYARLYGADGQIEKANIYFTAVDSMLKKYPDKKLQFLYLGCIVEKYRLMGKLEEINDTLLAAGRLQLELMPAYVMMRIAQKAKANGLLSKEEVQDIKNFTKSGNLDSTIWKEEKGLEEFNPLTVNLNRFDSSYNALYNRQLTEMETKYKTKSVQDSLDKTLYANTLKQVKITRQYWVITSITLLALLTGLLLYRINKEKKRAIADRRTIELLKEEADHRVKNSFSNIDSIIRDVKNKTNDVSSIQILEQRIEPLRLLFKILGNTATGTVDLQQYFETISKSLVVSFLNTQNVKVIVDAPVTIEGEKASKLGLIVNELLTNSFKHAFKNNSSGVIKIECKKQTTGKYRLTVNDSGAGWPEGVDNTKRRGGITQIKALAQQLDATCEIKSNEGAQFEFWFL